MISPVAPEDEAAILALNNEHAAELSWLEPERLSFLLGEAFYARRIGDLEAFIMTFDQDAGYDSPNFLWFCERYPCFVYVDRVVVAAQARGRGHARRLYQDLFDHVAAAGHTLVTCEVNIDPPNRLPMPFTPPSASPKSATPSSMAARRRCATMSGRSPPDPLALAT